MTRLALLGLVLLGLALGWLTVSLLFSYDGSTPINVVKVWAVLVALQLVLLIGFLVLAVPRGVATSVPLLRPLQDLLGVLSPGRCVRWIRPALPESAQEVLDRLTSTGSAISRSDQSLYKWLALTLSQWFAVSFNMGALAACLSLVTFTDLAFGWSTTLSVTADQVHTLSQLLSAPWQLWYPRAVPSADLITASQFFRLEGQATSATFTGHPGELGAWWPFLFMNLLLYGLLPRVASLVFAGQRLQSATRRAILDTAGTQQVLDRMRDVLVETRAATPEEQSEPTTQPVQAAGATEERQASVVAWSFPEPTTLNNELGWLRETFKVSVDTWYFCGGAHTLKEDEDVIVTLAEQDPTTVIVLVRSSESPTLELWDYVNDLGAALRPTHHLYLCPMGFDDYNRPTHPAAGEVTVWSKELAKHARGVLLAEESDRE